MFLLFTCRPELKVPLSLKTPVTQRKQPGLSTSASPRWNTRTWRRTTRSYPTLQPPWATCTLVCTTSKMTKHLFSSGPKLEPSVSDKGPRWQIPRTFPQSPELLRPTKAGKELKWFPPVYGNPWKLRQSPPWLPKPSPGAGAAASGWSSAFADPAGTDPTAGSPPWCITPTCPPRSG